MENSIFDFYQLKKYRNVCIYNVALKICHTCNNHTSKTPVFENEVCNDCMSKLNKVCMGTCTGDHMPFLARPKLLDIAKKLNSLNVSMLIHKHVLSNTDSRARSLFSCKCFLDII